MEAAKKANFSTRLAELRPKGVHFRKAISSQESLIHASTACSLSAIRIDTFRVVLSQLIEPSLFGIIETLPLYLQRML